VIQWSTFIIKRTKVKVTRSIYRIPGRCTNGQPNELQSWWNVTVKWSVRSRRNYISWPLSAKLNAMFHTLGPTTANAGWHPAIRHNTWMCRLTAVRYGMVWYGIRPTAMSVPGRAESTSMWQAWSRHGQPVHFPRTGVMRLQSIKLCLVAHARPLSHVRYRHTVCLNSRMLRLEKNNKN